MKVNDFLLAKIKAEMKTLRETSVDLRTLNNSHVFSGDISFIVLIFYQVIIPTTGNFLKSINIKDYFLTRIKKFINCFKTSPTFKQSSPKFDKDLWNKLNFSCVPKALKTLLTLICQLIFLLWPRKMSLTKLWKTFSYFWPEIELSSTTL